MADPPLTQPTARTFLIEELVALVKQGRVRIPEFQRPLRWQWEDVRRLFDSILRGYPIGSLLLWSRPAAAHPGLTLGALRVDAPSFDDAMWVVDGQQRITSLANALSDEGAQDPRFALVYDLEKRVLVAPAAERLLALPLPVLFDLQRLLRWFAVRPEAAEHLDEATRVAKAIRQYSAPAYIVKQEDESVLRDIFDRMNNFGRRLSRAEVFSALHSERSGSTSPRRLSDISEHIDAATGFGTIDEDTVLRAVLARRGPDVTRDIRVEFRSDRVSREFPHESAEDANTHAEDALARAIRFLQDDARVPHLSFLPYRYLLVTLARFFAHHPTPKARNRELLRRWFWRAAMMGPAVARGVYTFAIRTLASCVVPGEESASVQNLLSAVSPKAGTELSFTFPRMFKSTMAEVRFVLCTLWDLHPRSPWSGEPYDRTALSATLAGRDTASDALDVFLPRVPGARSAIGNRVILLGDDANGAPAELFGQRPMFVDEGTWRSVLESHVLNEQSIAALEAGDEVPFLDQRRDRLQVATRSFLERMTETTFEDTPPLDEFDLDDEGPGEQAPQ